MYSDKAMFQCVLWVVPVVFGVVLLWSLNTIRQGEIAAMKLRLDAKTETLTRYQERFETLNAKHLNLVSNLRETKVWDVFVERRENEKLFAEQSLENERMEKLVSDYRKGVKFGTSGGVECIVICDD